jgi:hypothetical protein
VLAVGAGLALALVAAGLSLVVVGLVRAARPELLARMCAGRQGRLSGRACGAMIQPKE